MPAWMDDDLADARRRDLFRVRRQVQSGQGRKVEWRGRRFLNFSSNDYLNLAHDPRLADAASRAAVRHGVGAGASPLVSGWLPPLRQLERSLATWKETDRAVVFSSGYAANLGLVSSLVGREDAVFSDALNHASLIDGCRLSGARIHVYRHADAGHLHDLLKAEGPRARRRLIVSDSVFSMDGDFAPLTELLDLARRHDALLLVDEAHATGVLGTHGRGLLDSRELFGPQDPDAVIAVGTLSKALGSQGGFVGGSQRLCRWIVNRVRPYIFSTALAPVTAAAAREAVEIITDEPERRQHLLALGQFLRDRLVAAGYPATPSRCQIVPVVVGDARAAVELSRRLRDCGLLVPAIRPPSVPEGTARLRISLTAGHTEEDADQLVEAIRLGWER